MDRRSFMQSVVGAAAGLLLAGAGGVAAEPFTEEMVERLAERIETRQQWLATRVRDPYARKETDDKQPYCFMWSGNMM